MSWILILIIVILAVSFTAAIEVAERRRLRALLDRPCAGIRWHRRFPAVPHNDIRSFLKLFTAAFAFGEVHSCKFGPDDQLLAIYRARYVPHLTLDDHMEFETLTVALGSSYGVNLEAAWRNDLTLGELFSLTRGVANRPA